MYRRNIDERLRKAERDLAQGGGVVDYCKYVNELRRAATLPPNLPAGEAFGNFPSAVHLFAPARPRDFPRMWLDEAFAGWNMGPHADQIKLRDERAELFKLCMPPIGIISNILQLLQLYLITTSPRRCTCGGYERGHSPDCEINVGTGDPSEDLYDVIREWTGDFRGVSTETLLDMFLGGGAEAVYWGLTQGEYDLYQVVALINRRLHPVLHLALSYTDGVFSFLLTVMHPAQVNNPIAGFKATVSHKNQCHIIWDSELSTPSYADWSAPTHQLASAANLSYQLLEVVRSIPMLIAQYPVWNWRARS